MSQPGGSSNAGSHSIKLFLCGDVMIGRGVDQILPHPSKPHLFEPYVRSALDYVEIAEQLHGPIRRPVDFAYIWGDALAELERARPDARIINLETAITTAEDAWPGKGIHYRMHPANAATLCRRENRLLHPCEQSCSRLGICGAGGDARHSAASGHSHRWRRSRRGRSRRTGNDRAAGRNPHSCVCVRHARAPACRGIGPRARAARG